VTTVRIATFNIENFDETPPGEGPSLDERIALMRPQIVRLRADIVCFQEVNGQERAGQPRALLALQRLLEGTNLAGATLISTKPEGDSSTTSATWWSPPFHPVLDREQLRNDLVAKPLYRRLTAHRRTTRRWRWGSSARSCTSRSTSAGRPCM
jgi:hypothetical protein